MNTNKRFLILDRRNMPQVPAAHGYHGPGLQSEKSPSFLTEEDAKLFGNWLSARLVGQRFYLAVVAAAVVQYTKPAEPAEWTATAEDAE